jgi:tetratricopeptide (TPR) repeat protein
LAQQDKWEALRREAISESLVGTVYFRQGSIKQDDEQFDKAEEIARGNPLVLSQIYEHRGHKEVWCYQDYLKAQSLFLKSLEYVEQIEDKGVQIGRRFWSLINLSGAANATEHFADAIGYACAARKIARQLKNDVLLAFAVNELGEQYFALGKMRLARNAFCRARTLFIEVGDEEWSRNLQLFMEQNNLNCEV